MKDEKKPTSSFILHPSSFDSTYAESVQWARKILSGNPNDAVAEMSAAMTAASEKQDYETAANLRDQIAALTTTASSGKFPSRGGVVATGDRGGFSDLEQWLSLPLSRVDVFDNSHLFGKSPVGAAVSFGPNGFIKSNYRHYKLKNAALAGNDIGMMTEFITRHLEKNSPDLIIVDGGRAQWNAAVRVIKKLKLNIPVLGVVKGAVRNGDESFILPNGKISKPATKEEVRRMKDEKKPTSSFILHPSAFTKDSALFLLLRRVRDEAHRFAISFHKKRRGDESLSSALDDIPGIGATRRRALLHHFGSVRGIANAAVRDIATVPGVSKPLAQKIYNYFHP